MAYIYLTDMSVGGVANTEPLVIDRDGHLVGIEIDGARALLTAEVLAIASRS